MDTVDQTYLSIGEVLALLQEEFPDVTISKIRFLESQGLIEPERTASGYRRFHEPDIDRLRWVLRQQRDHFLPLKVIKAKIDEGSTSSMDQPPLWTSIDANGAPRTDSAAPDPGAPETSLSTTTADVVAGDGRRAETIGPGGDLEEASNRRDPGAWLAELQEAPSGMPMREPRPPQPPPVTGPSERLSFEELVERTGASEEQVTALVDYGLLHPTMVSGERLFDSEAMEVVAIAAKFIEFGIEVRHLRSYRLAVDREAGVIEQLLLPLLKQKNPDARARAAGTYEELTSMGESLRRVLLHQALGPHLR